MGGQEKRQRKWSHDYKGLYTAGLVINQEKAKYIQVTQEVQVRDRNMHFEKLKGSLITFKNEKKVAAGNRCYYIVNHIFKSKAETNVVKIKLNKTVIRSIVIV